MLTFKQIREQLKEDKGPEPLQALVDAGLLEENKLPALKRALSQSPQNLTIAERKSLMEAVDLMVEASIGVMSGNKDFLSTYDKSRSSKYPREKDVPVIIILKRKAIRVFPDNQKVALYYSQYLNKYVSIPFGPKNQALGIHLGELTEEFQEEHQPEEAKESVVESSREIFAKRLQSLREEKINEFAPALPVVGAVAKAAGAAAAGRVALGAAKRIIKRGAKKVGKVLGKAKDALDNNDSKSSPPKEDNVKKRSAGEYSFSASGRQQAKISEPQRATADLSNVASVRQQNRMAWRNIQEGNLKEIKELAEQKGASKAITIGNDTITINNSIAKKVMKVYEQLNAENKQKLQSMLNENTETFRKAINFVVRQQ